MRTGSRPSPALALLLALTTSCSAHAERKHGATPPAPPQPTAPLNDAHLHLTNYVQQGPELRSFLKMMGNKVGRVAVFGIPLQQQWSYRVDGDRAPTYYLQTDSPLYYYSFTDAFIAHAYQSLPKPDQARFDPMITGFNPADMYAVDHVKRVLATYPGIFVGIGEFSIHKEFVTSKIAGGVPSLMDPALDRLLSFAEEAGLVVLLHNDMDVPFPTPDSAPEYLEQVKALLKRHPGTTIIWAHVGVGRVVRPVNHHLARVRAILEDPAFKHVMFDISWTETAKYIVDSDESLALTAQLLNDFPDRFLFGTDALAPKDQDAYLETYRLYEPLWPKLRPDTRDKVMRANYVRVFDEGGRRVRAWEAAHVH